MLLTKVILQDYGVYKGKNEFDFTCTPDKPIILIGGSNGAGKTTLFESIMLCFYGISTLGKRITKKSYDEFLAKKIHRYLGSTTSADFASIIVEFKYYHEGKETNYQVERTWRKEDGKVIEELHIKKKLDSEEKFTPLNTIEESHWQSFVEDLIPKGIAKLFFFDGEKIVEIAEDESEGLEIKSSFSSLLGLDVVEQLRTDLQVNLMRNLTNDDKFLKSEFEKYTNEKNEALEQINHYNDKIARKQDELDYLRTEIEDLEAQVSKIGGKFAQNREETRNSLGAKKVTLDNIATRIRENCGSVLPFSLIPNEMKKLKDQITLDQEIQKQSLEGEILKSKFSEINSALKDDSFWKEFDIKSNVRKEILTKISSLQKSTSQKIDEKPLFDFSSSQAMKILEIIDDAKGTILDDLKKDTEKYNEVNEEIVKFETSIASAPSDDEIGPLIAKLNEKHSESGTLQAEIDHLESQITTNGALLRHVNAKLRDTASQQFKNKKAQTQAELTEKVQLVLDEYVEKLKMKKLKLLEQYLLEAIEILMHKKKFIQRVSIDKDSFEVTLYRENNDPFPKDLLSKGEKQMFATAVLWALAKTSGKPLPFLIDTPLARLDEGHRVNLIEKFFPMASHQVAIFSTDSEITFEHYKKLKPYLTRAYAMEFLPEEGQTQKNSGYFWNDKGEKVVAI
jgi:DNA sulfur modification protein DndD